MLVKEIMTDQPQYIPPESTLQEVAQLMRNFDFGFIPVGENDRLIGTITDRDIILRAVSEGYDPTITTVRDILSDRLLYCWEDDDVEVAAKSLEEQQVHRLVVLNRDKRMVGIVSLGDIARVTSDERLCGEIVEHICERKAA